MVNFWQSIQADIVVRRLSKNLMYLFSANAVVGLIGLGTLAIMARALGPVGLGITALIEAYARSIDLFVRFESGQAVLRYGTEALEKGDDAHFRRLIKFSTLSDLAGSTTATVVGVIGAGFAGNLFGFDADHRMMLLYYAVTLLFSVSATPIAVLRIFDRFDILARTLVVVAVIRLAASVLAWSLEGGLWWFVGIMILTQIVEQLTPFAFAWRELALRGYHGIWRMPLNGLLAENPGLLRFIFNANVNVVARNTAQRFDSLILGALLGPASVGVYQIAKRLTLAATKFSRPIQQAIYPEIARLWARQQFLEFRRMVLTVNLTLAVLTIAIAVSMIFFGETILRTFFGEAFADADAIVAVQAVAVALFLSAVLLVPALLSMGEDSTLVRVTLLGTLIFFVILPPAILTFGVIGASFSHVVFNLILYGGYMAVFLRRSQVELKEGRLA